MDLIMGMNSGSSFDGIDVILAETEMAEDGFPKAPRFICGGSYEWPKEVADIVQDAFVNKVDMVGLNRLNYLCGAVFAEKAAQFLKENNIDSRDVKVLGLDTQTIYQEQPNHAAIAKMTKEEKAEYRAKKAEKELEDLKKMEEEGVEILTCGTCLKHYGLMEKLMVGKVTDMYTIAERMTGADKVIRP